jgi:GTP-binding protein
MNKFPDGTCSWRLYDHKGESDVPAEFLEWEAEELKSEMDKELQAENSGGKYVSDGDNSIPEYMKKLLFKFEDKVEIMKALPEKELPTIAIIGRPNTGKSTIANKLTNSYTDGAIVHDEAGVTRDCTYRTGSWGNYNFQVVDTGGIIFDDSDDIFADRITEQAILALESAQFAILVCDGKDGPTNLDEFLVNWLRKKCKVPMFLAVNKCESEAVGITQANQFWNLGMGTPYPVSGIHGTGLAELLDDICVDMEKVSNVIRENVTNIAFIGRPNVGKSSLFNKLLNQNRSIVSDIAGTTRDAIDEVIERRGTRYRIIDTAGIRRKGKVEYGAALLSWSFYLFH